MTKPFVFFLNVKFNQTSHVHLHGLCTMHETCAFSTNHGYYRVLEPNILLTALKFAWALSAMKPLKLTFFIMPTFLTSLVKENCIRICESTFSDCMSHISIVNILQYAMSQAWKPMVVQPWTHLTWSNMIHTFSRSLPSCMHITISTPLAGPCVDILKRCTLGTPRPRKSLSWMYS